MQLKRVSAAPPERGGGPERPRPPGQSAWNRGPEAAADLSGLAAMWRRYIARGRLPDTASVHQALLPWARSLPWPLRRGLRGLWLSALRLLGHAPAGGALAPPAKSDASYSARLANEVEIFSGQEEVHDLPPIFHYWSHRYLLPMQQAMGFSGPDGFFARHLAVSAVRTGRRQPRFLSIGSGNCEIEVRLATALRARGLTDFSIECLELNPAMRARGERLAAESGLAQQVIPIEADFNSWAADSGSYDGVMANQSLHHVMALEHLFGEVRKALAPGALFLTSDVIGRNGHQRWPEALLALNEFWQELPESFRYNIQLRRKERRFLDWDCSVGNFEGIRAQDVLPLLRQYFQFELFLPWGNIILPFIDRSFGWHFDPNREWDRDFIDRVHARDEAEIASGRIKPTQLYAVMAVEASGPCIQRGHLSPEFCTRNTSDCRKTLLRARRLLES